MSKTPLNDRLRQSESWKLVRILRALFEAGIRRGEVLKQEVKDNPTGLDAALERKHRVDHNPGRVR